MPPRVRPAITFAAFAAFALLASCSLDYRTGASVTSLPSSVPDTEVSRFTTTTIRGQNPYFRIVADHAMTFGSKNETILTGVRFQEFGTDGKVIAEGSADHAVYHTDTENAELDGHIELYSADEKARITADFLAWNNDDKTLTSKPESLVTIKKDNGSSIAGRGFTANTRTRTVQFTGGVQGSWVSGNGA